MSYLVSPSAARFDTKQAVISIWFRVPAATLNAASDEFKAWKAAWETARDAGDYPLPPRPPLTGIVPLMTFGPKAQEKGQTQEKHAVGTFPQSAVWHWSDGFGFPACAGAQWVMNTGTHVDAGPFNADYTVFNEERTDLDPSHIGIDCSREPSLSVHIVMPAGSTPSTIKGQRSEQTGYSNSAAGIPIYTGGGLCPGAPVMYLTPDGASQMRTVTNPPPGYSSVIDVAETVLGDANIYLTRPEIFRTLPFERVTPSTQVARDAADQEFEIPVEPDHWHHLLLSIDLTNNCSATGLHNVAGGSAFETAGARTTSACRMWVALDDNNLEGITLSAYWPRGSGDPNGILTVTGHAIACEATEDTSSTITDISGLSRNHSLIIAVPTYQYSPASLPFNEGLIGIPSLDDYVDRIKKVEMAELQIFAGVSLNTGVVDNRRAFISAEGEPVAPSKKATGDSPARGSIELLGRRPDILLNGSSNWRNGKNTGPDTDGAAFAPVGAISNYKPDPTLHGPQNPGEPEPATA